MRQCIADLDVLQFEVIAAVFVPVTLDSVVISRSVGEAGIFACLVGTGIFRVGRVEEIMVVGDMLNNAVSVADE